MRRHPAQRLLCRRVQQLGRPTGSIHFYTGCHGACFALGFGCSVVCLGFCCRLIRVAFTTRRIHVASPAGSSALVSVAGSSAFLSSAAAGGICWLSNKLQGKARIRQRRSDIEVCVRTVAAGHKLAPLITTAPLIVWVDVHVQDMTKRGRGALGAKRARRYRACSPGTAGKYVQD